MSANWYKPKDHQPQPGEMWMKEWKITEMNKTGLSETMIHNRLHGGKYPGVSLRRVSKRVIFVRVHEPEFVI